MTDQTPPKSFSAIPGGSTDPKPLIAPLQPLDIKTGVKKSPALLLFVVVGFLAAAAAFAFFSKGVVSPAVKPQAAKPVLAPSVMEVVKSSENTVQENSASVAQTPEKPLPSLSLSGILFGEKGSFALINGRVVSQGSTVEGARLDKVFADRVELSFEGKTIILRSR